jgi:hypothetical protein
MEKNMNSMAQEMDQMRTDLAKFEVIPWGTGMLLGPIYSTSLPVPYFFGSEILLEIVASSLFV